MIDVVAVDVAAGVQNVSGVASNEVVVSIVVVGDEDDGVCVNDFLGSEVDAGDLVVEFVGADPCVVDVDFGSEFQEFGDDPSGWGFSGVVGVLLVSDAENEYAAAVDGLLAIIEAELNAFGDVGWHGVVDVVCNLDKFGDRAEFSLELPREVGGVDGKAMAPDAGPWVEGHEAERLGFRCVDHIPEVNTQFSRVDGDFVDECDVDMAKGVFEEFGELGFFGAFGGEGGVDEVVVEGLDDNEGGIVDAGDDFRGALKVPGFVAWVDTFGGEAEVEVFARGQSGGLFDDWAKKVLGGARVSGGFEDSGGAGGDCAPDDLCCGLDVAHVGGTVAQRGGDGDDDDVVVGEVSFFAGCRVAASCSGVGDVLVGDVVDMASVVVETIDFVLVEVEANDGVPGFCGADRDRKADVALADDYNRLLGQVDAALTRVHYFALYSRVDRPKVELASQVLRNHVGNVELGRACGVGYPWVLANVTSLGVSD